MYKENTPTPHNKAIEGVIAKTVLMPGDPKRAKFIAEEFLSDPICFNDVRGMFGYTGTYKNKEVSIMGSGMGMPSIGIYSYELYKFYGVDNIIRIGSCGAYYPDTALYTVILAEAAYSDSSYLKVFCNKDEKTLFPSQYLNEIIEKTAKNTNQPITKCIVHSSDVFYGMNPEHFNSSVAPSNSKVVEMEAFALFANANALNKKAACILTVSDNIATKELTTSQHREKSLTHMIELALETSLAL